MTSSDMNYQNTLSFACMLVGSACLAGYCSCMAPVKPHGDAANDRFRFPALGLGVFQEFLYAIVPSLPIPVL